MAGRRKLTTTERGYGADHRALREQWAPLVATGTVPCHATVCIEPGGRLIKAGAPWHLGHNEARTAWTGPEHEVCNVTEGSHRGNPPTPEKAAKLKRWRPTREW